MNKFKWLTLQMSVTPKLLRLWADRLDKEMETTLIGEDVPSLSFKDYDNRTEIKLYADQEAWHKKDKGQWI